MGQREFFRIPTFWQDDGYLGLGRLGKITARIAHGFGMNVITYDPAQPFAENVRHVSFEN